MKPGVCAIAEFWNLTLPVMLTLRDLVVKSECIRLLLTASSFRLPSGLRIPFLLTGES